MNRGFAIFLIVIVGCGLFGWREYERQMRERLYKDRIKLKLQREQEKQNQIEELATIEKEDILPKVFALYFEIQDFKGMQISN